MKIIIMISVSYVIYSAMLYGMQRRMLFPRDMIPSLMAHSSAPAGIEEIRLKASFGIVDAWFMPPAESRGPAPLVIFAHGNAEWMDHWALALMPFTRMGMGVLLVEYPGYRRSEGDPSEKTITEVFTLAHDAMTRRDDVDPCRIVVFGRSVGGGAVCALAARRPTRAMILMSSFTSVPDIARSYLVPGFLIRDRFDNLMVVRKYANPILLLHGEYDDIVPVNHGRRLHENAFDARLVLYPAGHNDCPPDWRVFWEDVADFLVQKGILSRQIETPLENDG